MFHISHGVHLVAGQGWIFLNEANDPQSSILIKPVENVGKLSQLLKVHIAQVSLTFCLDKGVRLRHQ